MATNKVISKNEAADYLRDIHRGTYREQKLEEALVTERSAGYAEGVAAGTRLTVERVRERIGPRNILDNLAPEQARTCGAPLTDFVIDMGTCQRPKGHWGIHWFNDKAEAQARPEQDEAVRLREALARLVEHHQDAMGHGPSCKRLDEARAALATPPPAPEASMRYNKPVFSNPQRCSYCGSKGGHLRQCGNPILQNRDPHYDIPHRCPEDCPPVALRS